MPATILGDIGHCPSCSFYVGFLEGAIGNYFGYYGTSNEQVKRKVQNATENKLLYVIKVNLTKDRL